MEVDDFDYIQDVLIVDEFEELDAEDINIDYPYVIVSHKLWKLKVR